MNHITLSLLLLILCCTQGLAQNAEFTAMSYNIRYLNNRDGLDVWKNRREAVCSTIQSAAVAGLQEVVIEQLRDIQASTPDWEWYAAGREDGKTAGEATPIGWQRSQFELLDKGTFWLSPEPDRVGSKGWDAALPRIASWVNLRHRESAQDFIFLNTHFDHRGAQARTESAKVIRSWIEENSSDIPTILVGDFNAQLSSPPLDALLDESAKLPITNARTVSAKVDPGPNSTWNGFRMIEEGRRIDFIFVTPKIEVAEFETLDPKTSAGRFASDHLPLKAKVKLK